MTWKGVGMKFLIFYWILGCLIVGGAEATHKNNCPMDDETSVFELMGWAAIYPAVITYHFTANNSNSKPSCKIK